MQSINNKNDNETVLSNQYGVLTNLKRFKRPL